MLSELQTQLPASLATRDEPAAPRPARQGGMLHLPSLYTHIAPPPDRHVTDTSGTGLTSHGGILPPLPRPLLRPRSAD